MKCRLDLLLEVCLVLDLVFASLDVAVKLFDDFAFVELNCFVVFNSVALL